jgi:hypothetical protein
MPLNRSSKLVSFAWTWNRAGIWLPRISISGMAKMHAGDLEAAESSILNAREMYSQIGDEHFEARWTLRQHDARAQPSRFEKL